MAIGSTTAIYRLYPIRVDLNSPSWNPNETLTVYIPLCTAIVILLYILIGIFHLLETRNTWCSNCCLPFTKREEYGGKASQEEATEFEMHEIA